MIIKIEFSSEGEIYTMLFGDSYKKRDVQLREYLYTFKNTEILKIESCPDKWIGFGGLKWCNINEFQDKLNRENPENPRFFENMKFSFSENIADKVNQIYEKIRN